MATSDSPSSPTPPAPGTFIDNGALELVEILGYGGYGVVYRAVDTFSPEPASYAVKCLPHSNKRNATRQRQLHLREITLHQLASAHPNVVTLHRVVEEYQFTYIVMDYCPDGDLFTQILHNRRYLGDNELIKEVFLQLLDAVEYCHSLNIYHRDLKPENVLCFDGGMRLAITDFGLATTDRMSTEFRTGSVYHMSPECQGGYFAPTKSYSPLFNDVWSLGIILLNLITGRNPWKSASEDDCTFQAYLKDPMHFLPTVLPISEEVNLLLTRVLEVDWRRRITLREMRLSIKAIDNFYSPDVLFEDSMARCPWEAGYNAESDESSESSAEEAEQRDFPDAAEEGFASAWSIESGSEMVFAAESATERSSWADVESYDARNDAYSRSMSPSPSSPLFTTTKLFDALQTPSTGSAYSVLSSSASASIPSLPVTPNNGASTWSAAAETRPPKGLKLDIAGCQALHYNDPDATLQSAVSSSMQTALESHMEAYGLFSPWSYADSIPTKASLILDSTEDIGMITTPTAGDDMDFNSVYTYPTIDGDSSPTAVRPESPILGASLGYSAGSPAAEPRSAYDWNQMFSPSSPSRSGPPTSVFSFLSMAPTPAPSPQSERASESSWHHFPFLASNPPSERCSAGSGAHTFSFFATPPSSPAPLPIKPPPSPASRDRKTRPSSFLNPIRLAFPRRSSSPAPAKRVQTGSAPARYGANWAFSTSTSTSPAPQPYLCLPPRESKVEARLTDTRGLRRRRRLQSARDWFSPGKLFAAVLPSHHDL
ncbi:kinase-like protein [Amylocystis lapponica]|nr:kinase-like protein [Amylocystis lapponica]